MGDGVHGPHDQDHDDERGNGGAHTDEVAASHIPFSTLPTITLTWMLGTPVDRERDRDGDGLGTAVINANVPSARTRRG